MLLFERLSNAGSVFLFYFQEVCNKGNVKHDIRHIDMHCNGLFTLSVVVVVVLLACSLDLVRASRGSLLLSTPPTSSTDSTKNNHNYLRRLPSLLHNMMFSAVGGSSAALPPVPPVSGTGNKQILISGGAGYIGTHTIVCLLEAGYDGETRNE